jgi:hypothetical protein
MKCKAHVFGASGKCRQCGKRRPGRPKSAAKVVGDSGPAAAPMADPVAAPEPATLPPPAADYEAAARVLSAEREARLRSLFAPPPEVHVVHEKPDPEPERKTTVKGEKEDWTWVAGVATEGIDVATGWAIGAWSDLEPMEASASSRRRFASKLGVFAEQRLGAVEVPTWIVLVICLVALVMSKIIGAPKKSEAKEAERASVPAAPPVPVPTAAPSVPVAAAVVASAETSSPVQPIARPVIDGGGSAQDAQSGF